ncbi:TonB family protein [Mangrovibacterium diazotrophicum]|uniref:TonB family protein n=1 Tax=Mangrovibacterium diazotrophicum TaxID=1261403 RepID=A0A419WBL5_9BACT|nr:TonB family protein [Mangrovibacterium diazotrophicum]RKD92853.1 TonB family protein [Mangrovibacterium diazotrophicum]
METILQIIIRISIGSALFYAFYALLLRKTTFFKLNRLYLLAAIVLPVLFALFPLQYTVWVEGKTPVQAEDWAELFKSTTTVPNDQLLATDNGFSWSSVLIAIYCTGLFLLALRLLIQSIKPIRLILTNKKGKSGNYSIVENRHFSVPFSFFNHIFIHPEYHKQEDLDVILAHEEVHIRERHWIDLLVIELFTLVFWFNPISWLLEQAIKQNHEYLADQGVLSRGQSPARYQLLLVNQLMGMQVLGLSNNLNFALGPTRLNMMKKQKTSRKQLLRFGLLFPVVAGLLFAFAQPKYHLKQDQQSPTPINSTSLQVDNNENNIILAGTVQSEFNLPMPGASIVIQGTTIGTVAGPDGRFKLELPEGTKVFLNKEPKEKPEKIWLAVKLPNAEPMRLVASFVGYHRGLTSINDNNSEKPLVRFIMNRSLNNISTDFKEGDVPPPPPPPVPESIRRSGSDEVFVVVEEMPQYPGGQYALAKYINEKKKEIKNKEFFDGIKLSGTAVIRFTVSETGTPTNFDLWDSSGNEKVDQYAATIVKGMEDWTPGKQRGKAVPVDYAVKIEF